MSLTPEIIAAMTKPELEQLRADYLRALAGPPSPQQHTRIQNSLALVNQAIKKLNIDKSRADKSAADRRKSAGLAEQRDNTARAFAKVSPLVANPPLEDELVAIPIIGTVRTSGRPAIYSPNLVAPSVGANGTASWPKGISTRGECILMRAEQLRNQLRRLVDPLPYTQTFRPLLDAFIAEQKILVDQERALRKAGRLAAIDQRTAEIVESADLTMPSQWQETWKDNR